MNNHEIMHSQCVFALKEYKDDPEEFMCHLFSHKLLDSYEILHGNQVDKCLCCAVISLEREYIKRVLDE